MLAVRFALAVAGVALAMLPRPSEALIFCDGSVIGVLLAGTPGITVTPMNFGTYVASLASPDTANSTVTVTCMGASVSLLPSLPAFTITLSAGNGLSFSPRKLTGSAATLGYNIYTTAALSSIWGDGTGGSVTQSGGGSILSASTQTFTAYGAIPTGQWVRAGTYTDMITVTVTY